MCFIATNSDVLLILEVGDGLENQMGVVTRLGVASCILIFEVDLVEHDT
jgi:hypothetical protein